MVEIFHFGSPLTQPNTKDPCENAPEGCENGFLGLCPAVGSHAVEFLPTGPEN